MAQVQRTWRQEIFTLPEDRAQELVQGLQIEADPRREQGRRHPLHEVVFMALCAVLSGAESYHAVERFAREQRAWLEQFLRLRHGIPTHDTFERVFRVLRPAALRDVLMALVSGMVTAHDEVVAVDGKSLRRSFDRASERGPLHLLHAFGTQTGLVLGQEAVDNKENEIVAIPRVLEQFDVRGRVLTFDAMGCQKSVADAIVSKKGDFVMQLKDNHPTLRKQLLKHLELAEQRGFGVDLKKRPYVHGRDEDLDKAHGRIEQRDVDTLDISTWLPSTHPEWKAVKTVARVRSTRTVGEHTSHEVRLYLTSLPAEQPARIAHVIRTHWSVENNLHWCLDVTFDEDQCRVRKDHGPENLATFRRFCLTLLKNEPSKGSLRGKRQSAAWNPDFRLKLLGFS